MAQRWADVLDSSQEALEASQADALPVLRFSQESWQEGDGQTLQGQFVSTPDIFEESQADLRQMIERTSVADAPQPQLTIMISDTQDSRGEGIAAFEDSQQPASQTQGSQQHEGFAPTPNSFDGSQAAVQEQPPIDGARKVGGTSSSTCAALPECNGWSVHRLGVVAMARQFSTTSRLRERQNKRSTLSGGKATSGAKRRRAPPQQPQQRERPEATEEERQRRVEHRQAGVNCVKRSAVYLSMQQLQAQGFSEGRSDRPRTPDPRDESISKRSWEGCMQGWRGQIRRCVPAEALE